MTEDFIKDLQRSSYFQRIFKDHDVIMVAFTGSRAIDITDERSDFDLIVLTNDTYREDCPSEFLTYNGKKVHWHYVPVMKLIANEEGNLLSCVGEVEFAGLDDEKILYANPRYDNVIEFLKVNKQIVALVGSYGLVRFHSAFITKILNANEIKPEDYCKFIYHLCYTSYFLLLEDPDKEFLNEIKRIRWKPVSDEYKHLAVERLRLLKKYVDENPIDLRNIISTFNGSLINMLN